MVTGRRHIVFFLIFVFFFSGSFLFAELPLIESSVILAKNVIDLRAESQLRTKSNNQPGRVAAAADLEVGSIFISVDNVARKVVDIYEYNGRTVIETIEPRIEEVFLGFTIPDFEVECTRDDVVPSSLTDGVTLLPPGVDRGNMLSAGFDSPAEEDRSVSWLETNPDTENKDVLSFNINKVLWSQSVSGDVLADLKKKKDDAKQKQPDPEEENGVSAEAGGKPSLDMGASGEIRLIGTLRVIKPTITGGARWPYIEIVWVHDWWIFYHPEFIYHKGYAKAEFFAAQQFDFKITGTIKLTSALKIPLFGVSVKKEGIELSVGFFIKITLEGEISIAVEVSEFTKISVGASCDLHGLGPICVPVKFRGYQNNYLNMAFRPIISAEAELKAGLSLEAAFELLGLTIVGAEIFGGGYIAAEGYMEPMGIMGFDSSIGGYGNFDDWILDVTAEAGVFLDIGAEIITIDIPIYNKKWPFWEWHKSWGF